MSKRALDERPTEAQNGEDERDDKKSKKQKSSKNKSESDNRNLKKHKAEDTESSSSSDSSSSDSDDDSSSSSSSSSSSGHKKHHKSSKNKKSSKKKKEDKKSKDKSKKKSKDKKKSDKDKDKKKKSGKDKDKKGSSGGKEDKKEDKPKSFFTAVSRADAAAAAAKFTATAAAAATSGGILKNPAPVLPGVLAVAASTPGLLTIGGGSSSISSAAAAGKGILDGDAAAASLTKPQQQEGNEQQQDNLAPSAEALQLQAELDELRRKFNLRREQQEMQEAQRALELLEEKKRRREEKQQRKNSDSNLPSAEEDDDDFGSDGLESDDDLDDNLGGGGFAFFEPSQLLHHHGQQHQSNGRDDDDEILALFAGSKKTEQQQQKKPQPKPQPKKQQQPQQQAPAQQQQQQQGKLKQSVITSATFVGADDDGDDDFYNSFLKQQQQEKNDNDEKQQQQQEQQQNDNNDSSSAPAVTFADALLGFVNNTVGAGGGAAQNDDDNNNNNNEDEANDVFGNGNDDETSNFHVDDSYLKISKQHANALKKGGHGTTAVKTLPPFDPSEVSSDPIEKNFYIPPNDVQALTEEEVVALRESLDGAKVIGDDPPRPMRSFDTCGLNDATVDVLRKRGFLQPFAVQALAVPVLMSGRDLVLTAKTGSGKTLAYLLPLIRHVKNQRRARPKEGPVGLIIVPTHELADQIETVAHDLFVANQLHVLRAYGSTKIQVNFQELARGVDVCIATPGRLYDICARNASRLFLSRCSFVVLDEADRLFDEGLGKTVQELLVRVRPDHQFALVSSTMPKEVRRLFKHMFKGEEQEYLMQLQRQREEQQQGDETAATDSAAAAPPPRSVIEISVGGRPNPSTNVAQSVEFFDLPKASDGTSIPVSGANVKSDPRWRRLLQILGEHYESSPTSLVIIFVEAKELCDHLYVSLESAGYTDMVGTLYAGRDTEDRVLAMADFAEGRRPILIATAVAERGLDVSDLDLVINFDVPNHFEAYVNRIGRTGRAGRRGKAVTFFLRNVDDHLASMLLWALDGSQQLVPDELKLIASAYDLKVKEGHATRKPGNFAAGYCRSRAFTFQHDELHQSGSKQEQTLLLEQRKPGKNNSSNKSRTKRRGGDDDADGGDSDMEGEGNLRRAHDPEIRIETAPASGPGSNNRPGNQLVVFGTTGLQQQHQPDAVDAVRRLLEQTNQRRLDEESGNVVAMRVAEFPLNEYGERIRRRLTAHKQLQEIGEETDTSISVRGRFVTAAARRLLQEGERELHLHIRGPTELCVTKALRKIDEIIDEEAIKTQGAAGFYAGK